MSVVYPRIGGHKTVAAFQQHLDSLHLKLPIAEKPLSAADGSSLARPFTIDGRTIGNRWCVHPMEGWDGETDGRPTEPMRRRWRNFGLSGCKLIWGCEAFAVRPDGRANPRQLMHRPGDLEPLRDMLNGLRTAHRESFGTADDLFVGLQLTHSGRFCKPNRNDRFESRIAYRHPVLDSRVGLGPGDEAAVFRDDELPALIDAYVAAARTAARVGFDFVDVKACHGYLMHEFLSGFTRPAGTAATLKAGPACSGRSSEQFGPNVASCRSAFDCLYSISLRFDRHLGKEMPERRGAEFLSRTPSNTTRRSAPILETRSKSTSANPSRFFKGFGTIMACICST